MPAHEEALGQATEGSSNSTYEGINLGFHDTAQDYTDHGDCTAYRGPDGSPLNENHAKMLAASGIPPEHAVARGYETIVDSRRLAAIGIVKAARGRVPGLLIPLLRRDGSTWGYQYRPDDPRLRDDKPIKYETPWEQRNGLDIPPGMGDLLDDPCVPLWVTEGSKKADCGAQYQLCIVALMGVWNWRGTNDMGGKTAVGDWNDIAVNGRRVPAGADRDGTPRAGSIDLRAGAHRAARRALHHRTGPGTTTTHRPRHPISRGRCGRTRSALTARHGTRFRSRNADQRHE